MSNPLLHLLSLLRPPPVSDALKDTVSFSFLRIPLAVRFPVPGMGLCPLLGAGLVV